MVGGAGLARGGARGRRGGRGPAAHRCREALAEHEPVERPLAASTWGEGKDLRTWDSPPVADLAWARAAARAAPAARRSSAGRSRGAAAERAARELLALQASDWAFLDQRGQAGDYAFQRATDHAESALFEAIDSAPRQPIRACARSRPDLSLAPLLEP